MPKRKTLRPLPKAVKAPSGPVPVRRKANLVNSDTGERCRGLWDPAARIIWIDAELSLSAAWPTLHHERVHAWLDDSGFYWDLDNEAENARFELLCDTLAHCMMLDMWDHS